jgi:hypothetical protein
MLLLLIRSGIFFRWRFALASFEVQWVILIVSFTCRLYLKKMQHHSTHGTWQLNDSKFWYCGGVRSLWLCKVHLPLCLVELQTKMDTIDQMLSERAWLAGYCPLFPCQFHLTGNSRGMLPAFFPLPSAAWVWEAPLF